LDSDTTLSFLLHEVGGSSTIVHFTNLVNFAGELKDTLGGGGLTRVYVRENTNVAVQTKIFHLASLKV
jgi:hypothetical protein